jgi:hypothetical protein
VTKGGVGEEVLAIAPEDVRAQEYKSDRFQQNSDPFFELLRWEFSFPHFSLVVGFTWGKNPLVLPGHWSGD